MRQIILAFTFLLGSSPLAWTQVNSQKIRTKNTETKAKMLGETAEVRTLISSGSDFASKKKIFRKNRQAPKNFVGRRSQSKAIIPALEHQGVDPLRQGKGRQDLSVAPIVNRDGIGDEGSPLDPTGDVGLQYYLQAVNVTDIGIFDKTGRLVTEFALGDLWAPLGAFSAGDPIVLYDETENRWFLTEFTDPANLLIAVSASPDPLGSYFVYSFSTPEFPDYPKYGIWPDALILTTNEGFLDELTQYFIEKEPLIQGSSEVRIQRIQVPGNENTEAGFYVSTPVDIDGLGVLSDARPIAMKLDDSSWGGTPQDEIDLYRFEIDWEDPSNTAGELLSIPLSPFDGYPCSVIDSTGISFDCIPQGARRGLDGIPETIMNVPKLRKFDSHESLVLSFITDVTDGENLSGIRWVELRKTDTTDWILFQEGTYAPDSLDRFMPSIAMDKKGNIGLGFNVSSPNDFVGVRFTGRLATDSLGIMTLSEYPVVEGLGPIFSDGRFGDYSHMSVDPSNGLTFWYTTEYAGDGTFTTESRIVAFELEKDTFDLEIRDLISPLTSGVLGAEESVSILLHNRGLEPLSDIKLGFSLDNTLIETLTFPDTLAPDSSVIVDFPTLIDLSEERSYTIQVFTSHPLDVNPLNDTLTRNIIHLSELDATLSIQAHPDVCSPNTSLIVQLSNEGANPLVAGTFEVQLNGQFVDSISWKGNIPTDGSEIVELPILALSSDTNQVVVTFIEGNDEVEGNLSNNVDSIQIVLDPTKTEYILELLTDDFPSETLWQITEDSVDLIAFGGPYFEIATLESIPVCLPDTGCFEFTIFDTAEDGICCEFGEGSYQLLAPDGSIVFESTGEFTDRETQQFCLPLKDTLCTLSANIVLSQEDTGSVADVLVEVEGGFAPYQYSLDGGSTFQDSALFEAIEAGTYVLVVEDSTGCSFTDTVQVSILTSLNPLLPDSYSFHLFPNPNTGYFSLEFSSQTISQHELMLEVLDRQGKVVQKRRVNQYSGVFKAPISLVAYPRGTYFVRLKGEQFQVAKRVLVQ